MRADQEIEMSELIIEIPALPPIEYSPNSRVHWSQRFKAGNKYSHDVFYMAVDARNKAYLKGITDFPWQQAYCEATFFVAEERIRDENNWRARFKPGQDALVSAGLILKDDMEHLQVKVSIVVDKDRAPLTIIKLGKSDNAVD